MLNDFFNTPQNLNIQQEQRRSVKRKSNIRPKSTNINLNTRFADRNTQNNYNPLNFQFKPFDPISSQISQKNISPNTPTESKQIQKPNQQFLSNQVINQFPSFDKVENNNQIAFPSFNPLKSFPLKETSKSYQTPVKQGLPISNTENKTFKMVQKKMISSNNSIVRVKKDKNEDEVSIKSKASYYSNTSRYKILRPVSINNNEHLFNLHSKEDKLKKNNVELIDMFINNMKGMGNNIKNNLSVSYLNNINKIWDSYIRDQKKSGKFLVNESVLNSGVENIKNVFNNLLIQKTEYFIQEIILKSYQTILEEIDKKNNEKIYLDDDVNYLMKNHFNDVKTINTQQKNKIEQFQKNYYFTLNKNKEEFENSLQIQLEAYENEILFKLKSDEALVLQTLNQGLRNLFEKQKSLTEELNFLINRNNESNCRLLENEISILESKIANKKTNLY